jgi:hypothetical protein
MGTVMRRDDGETVELGVPLFWYDPPWHRIGVSSADAIAVAVSGLGVPVSALISDLAGADQHSTFHDAPSPENEAEDEGDDHGEPLPRIVPYRPERYGLCDHDFDGARVIDVRLTMNRDESGRFAFSPGQIERWETTPASQPLAGGGWVPAATFPPDVVSLQHLAAKFHQLRALSQTAAVFVSMGPHRLEEELADIVVRRPDGLILRLDELDLDGLQLAAITRRTRQLVDLQGLAALPLWIVPGEITPDDAAKLVALGASAVAIDSWCAPIIEEAENQHQQSSARSAYSSLSRTNDERLVEMVDGDLATKVGRFKGLLHSTAYLPSSQRLGTLNETWSKVLGVRRLSLPLVSET